MTNGIGQPSSGDVWVDYDRCLHERALGEYESALSDPSNATQSYLYDTFAKEHGGTFVEAPVVEPGSPGSLSQALRIIAKARKDAVAFPGNDALDVATWYANAGYPAAAAAIGRHIGDHK